MKKANQKTVNFIYGISVFAILFLFFVVIKPIAVFDTDDWMYIESWRLPIPMIKAWNPIKVFPEFFMPLVSYFGALTFYPFFKDYCFVLALSHGIFISLVLTLYFVEYYMLLKRKL